MAATFSEKESSPDRSQLCEGGVFVSIPDPIKNGKAFDLPVFLHKNIRQQN
jgi:hypothetical protein